MPKQIYITLDQSDKYFSEPLKIKDRWGMVHKVDGFKVVRFCGKTSIEILLFRLDGKRINIMRKTKRTKFVDNGELLISVEGEKYPVGTFVIKEVTP